MTFGTLVTLLLAFSFIYLSIARGSTFYWSGHLKGPLPKDQRGPTIPQWIGRLFFLCTGGWLLYRSILELRSK